MNSIQVGPQVSDFVNHFLPWSFVSRDPNCMVYGQAKEVATASVTLPQTGLDHSIQTYITPLVQKCYPMQTFHTARTRDSLFIQDIMLLSGVSSIFQKAATKLNLSIPANETVYSKTFLTVHGFPTDDTVTGFDPCQFRNSTTPLSCFTDLDTRIDRGGFHPQNTVKIGLLNFGQFDIQNQFAKADPRYEVVNSVFTDAQGLKGIGMSIECYKNAKTGAGCPEIDVRKILDQLMVQKGVGLKDLFNAYEQKSPLNLTATVK
ncbi:MAG: hypothetical protein S4CHLAM6_13650 [Chlamydiae bacterium]|nr:hypothetical protein [Chlamydiota bacterium]